jgi:hypothetical protein
MVNIVTLPRLQAKSHNLKGWHLHQLQHVVAFTLRFNPPDSPPPGRIRRGKQPATIRRVSKFSISKDFRDAPSIQTITITSAIGTLPAKSNQRSCLEQVNHAGFADGE